MSTTDVNHSRASGGKNILLVDQGVSFGGALVVLVSIAKNLKAGYNPTIVSAIEGDVSKWIDIGGDFDVLSLRPAYTYVDRFNAYEKIRRVRWGVVRKLIVYFLSLYELVVNLRYVLDLCKIIKKRKIDVVHVNNSIYVLMAAAITGTPCVWHIHGVVEERRSFLHRIFESSVACYLAISNYVSDSAAKHGYPKSKLVTVWNPVSDQFVRDEGKHDKEKNSGLRDQYGLVSNSFLIAVFGRIIAWKGQLEAVKAFAEAELGKDVYLVLVGGSTEGFGNVYIEEIKKQAELLGVEKNIIWAGFIRDVHEVYRDVDLVLHSSIEPEPFGLVVTEAMASDVPIIASKLGAPKELINNGVTGLLVDPRNPKEFSMAIKKVVMDAAFRELVTQNAKASVKEHFLPTQYADRICEIYESTISPEK
ncbi:Glycosyltransferase [Hahella chejuensis KCTC 2396]|uniref:Glycosyltransferase n=1 Tax=Hahella chejuensis (strain KCTC 2396) TaxID=349521 RepID=Q2SIL1_HAHCH|nr:glycosyltransferase family 4 protein [Hahella chejuensis]ABC29513.1 Glycosyltransferase [Hahella chejuensis KCTC 2396]